MRWDLFLKAKPEFNMILSFWLTKSFMIMVFLTLYLSNMLRSNVKFRVGHYNNVNFEEIQEDAAA